ncbi:response regulator transcription factor [Stackebrandtia nassauensis]|uniref:response regulator transcription factor n=1 Tax=Stackebrandtia nassauensis TaxID=283811 RepID=UPI000A311ADA|nr:LuxR C-terminal-related transcriptional regulator [Stackebrandtia nassauensis]
MAERLGIAPGTVKIHIGRILDKLELRDRVQIVIFAYETGLILPGGLGSGRHKPRIAFASTK